MTLFYILLIFLICQRIIELIIAKQNEIWLRKQGAIEFGRDHYYLIVMMHILFFVAYFGEVTNLGGVISPYWYVLFPVFLLLQIGRVWVITSLGKYWNTRIFILPNGTPQTKGPYRFIKHPNYLIVAVEFVIIPLLFQATTTAILFTVYNAVLMMIRIQTEEKALHSWEEYNRVFADYPRFFRK
ncbi:hypothetical protein OEV98_08800 [Caldibacillus lycopersici]|uniref:Isoprenylcysteine carboxyl methyltransferase n=1 Tax=Perspicuibacillus lycopersici TaxID=1325689 RepID=A0AAE3IS73_9BACI|nr:isoprenylcysteine carboxylmethyltransferase family protein [Perspicuibacillus lycopersici]MCU9613658.1 hypothetical protein [Perspicuibacillus lycopersici]